MIYVNNIFALPLVLLAGCLDAFVLLAGLRLILGQLAATRNSRTCAATAELTDPAVRAVDSLLTRYAHRPMRPWVSWAIVILVALVVRHLAVRVIGLCV
ncbi:MAG: hypothetical protein JW955_21780 [Sedimentisphaerales bacterium]|nr:hypothetical protein [Sedimentisphaerales bacterium]